MEIRCIIMYANSASCDHYDDDDGHGRPWQALTAAAAAAAALATSCTTRASNQGTIAAAAAAAILVAAEAVAAAAAAKLEAEVLGRRWSTGDVRYVTATSAVVTYREASFIVYSVFQNIMHPAFATSD